MELLTWGGIITIALVLFGLFDRTQHDQIHGSEPTEEENAKKRNPFLLS